MGAVVSSWDAPRAILTVEALFIDIMLLKQKGDAHTAVHPTGSNEVFFHHNYPLPDPADSEVTVNTKNHETSPKAGFDGLATCIITLCKKG